jgi:MscS family membrane protein
MKDVIDRFLQYRMFDNPVEMYLRVAGVILLAFIVKRIISKYLTGVLYKLITRAGKKFNREAFCNLLIQPLDTFLIAIVTVVAIDQLRYPHDWKIEVYGATLHGILISITNGILIWIFIWLCLRIIDFIATVLEERASLTKSQSDNQLIVFFKDFFKVVLIIIGGLLLIRFVFRQDVGNLLTGLSIVGAAIALATRESLENLIASFIIFFDKPFVTGDSVKVNNFTGTIEKIGLRSTRIRTLDKTYISVPNKQMVDSIVDNISLRTQRKAELRLELKLSVTTNDLRSLISQIKQMLNNPKILKSSVRFTETGKNANVITIEFFTGMELTDEAFNSFKEEVNFTIMALIEKSGTDFAALNIDSLMFDKHNEK